MPNFANKSRLPPMDGAMLTTITRTSATTNADKGRGANKKTTSSGSGSALISGSSSGSTITAQLTALRQNRASAISPIQLSILPSIPQAAEYGWLFIDNDNMAWTTDASMSSFTSVGVKFPQAGSYGFSNLRTMECVWTGTQWVFFNNDIPTSGVWRSSNLLTWTNIGFSTTSGSVAIVPTESPSIFYVSGSGIGLWKTTDGGVTFAQKTLANANVSGKAVFAYYADTLWSGGRLIHSSPLAQGSIFTSDDDGATWTLRDSVGTGNFELMKVGTTIYAGGRGTIRQSTDNGTTWTATTSTASTYNQGLRYTGSIWVTVGVAGGIRGPMWTSSLTGTPFVAGTTTSGSMYGFDSSTRQIHYNGTAFVYWDRNNSTCFRSTDGKVWSPLLHPNAAAGKKFFVGFPKIADPNKNLF